MNNAAAAAQQLTATTAAATTSAMVMTSASGIGGGAPAAIIEAPSSTATATASKLFVYGGVDIRDEFEEKYERAHIQLQSHIANLLSDKELHDHLSALACKDKPYEDICLGLLYQILTDPAQAPKAYRDLTLLTRDGLGLITTSLAMLVAEKYQKLTDCARRQSLWALRELVRNQVLNVDNIVWNIMRHAAGGDVSARNLQLIDGLLDILIDHRPWLEKHPFLVGAVVYTYVRLIEDHHGPALASLRAKETRFVVALIRDRFADVMPLGRDFVRVLQNVARVPEFEQLWRDILHQPKTLLASFTGVWQLLHTRTSRRFLQCRLTPEVERKVHFMTNSVKFGLHKRYQDWFQDKYFATPESHSLRSDLIRFIVNAIHPTNDMLCSDIVPRWAIIGWILTSCTSQTALANAKLALFYDWLVFDPLKDNIMNVEPGILVMWHSIRNHPLVSSTLLDFLCRIMRSFSAHSEERIRAGVYNSLRKILEKQVIPNLQPLFESPKLDRELRSSIRESFREFCSPVAGDITDHHPFQMEESRLHSHQLQHHNQQQQQLQPQQHAQATPVLIASSHQPQQQPHSALPGSALPVSPVLGGRQTSVITSESDVARRVDPYANVKFSDDDASIDAGNGVNENDDEGSSVEDDKSRLAKVLAEGNKTKKTIKCEETDDDDDLPLSKVRLKEKPIPDTVDLPAALAVAFDRLLTSRSGAAVDSFLHELRTGTAAATSLDAEQEQYVVATLGQIVRTTLPADASPFADSKSDERALAASIALPLFRLFRCMYQFEEKLKKPVAHLLRQVFRKLDMPCGHLMLYFLKVTTKLQSRNAGATATGATSAANSSTGLLAAVDDMGDASVPEAIGGGFKTNVYRLLCDYLDETLDVCLARDLAELEAASGPVFLWLLPDVVREFKPTLLNNSAMLRVLCGCVDARGLRDLIYSVTQGKLTLFKNEGLLRCVRESLTFETFEQYCLWQLVLAHDVPIEHLQDLLPDLESSNHAEALTYMLLMLKNEKPTSELIRLLLSREAKSRGDQFVTSALRYWCQHFEENLSENIGALLTSKYPHSSPNKRKRPLKGNAAQNSTPTADQLLSHLEHFRRSCRHGNGTGTGLYVQDAMQRALQQAFVHSNDSTKKLYSDLFALAAEDDTSGVGRRGTSGRGRKAPANKKQDTSANIHTSKKAAAAAAAAASAAAAAEPINVLYSSDGESSEDDWTKPKTPKRRKKAISDSD